MNTLFSEVKVILFDSGHTLNKPRTGNWFIPPKYNEILDVKKLNINSLFFKYAMFCAHRYLNKNHLIKTDIEEYQQFKEFYSIILNKSRYSLVSDAVIDALAHDTVFNDEKFEFFDEAEPVIKILGEKYKLGILSDTWPSLERVFINKGLRPYFSYFIMSSIHGAIKSDGKLFRIALDELKCKPNEIAFIDDSESNLKMAQKMGILPIKACKYNGKKPSNSFYNIYSLKELETLFLP